MHKFIVFEGIDGAGTETQSKLLEEYLRRKGLPAHRLRYPDYSTVIGRAIHEYLHSKERLPPETLLLLYAADMLKDAERINEMVEREKIVICDRYFTSALAYQVLAGVPLKKCLRFAEMFGIPVPDIVIYLDISPKTAIKRKLREKNNLDRNESDEGLLGDVAKQYKRLIEKNIFSRWAVVDGERPVEEVFEDVRGLLGIQ